MLLLRQVESSGHGSSPPPRRPPGSLGAELVNRRAHWKGFPNAAVTSALSPRPDFLGGRPRTPSRPPARPSPPQTAGRGLGPGGQAGVTLGAAGQAWWGRGAGFLLAEVQAHFLEGLFLLFANLLQLRLLVPELPQLLERTSQREA